jgi:N-acetylneuraminic acid mutarotase
VVVSANKVYAEGTQEEACSALSTGLPTSVYFPASATVDGKIYVFSGSQSYKRVYCFDPENDTKSNLGDLMPVAMCAMGCAAVGTNIYLFGGRNHPTNANGYSQLNYVLKFDTINKTMTTLDKTYNGTKGAGGIAAAAIGSTVYLFGGFAGDTYKALSWISFFDCEAEDFVISTVYMPDTRYSATCAAVGTKIYVFGGTTTFPLNSGGMASILCYDSETNQCEQITTELPVASNGMASAVFDGKVYLFGGWLASGTGNTILCFDPTTNELRTLETTLPSNCVGASASCVGDNIYIFGGNSNRIIRYSPAIGLMSLDYGTMQIIPNATENIFPFINTDTVRAEIGVEKVYKGNENNEGEPVEAALYKDGAWTTI